MTKDEEIAKATSNIVKIFEDKGVNITPETRVWIRKKVIEIIDKLILENRQTVTRK